MSGVVEVLAGIGLVVASVVMQVRGQALRRKRVVILPAILLVIGFSGLSGMPSVGAADVVLIAIGAMVAALIGVAQGFSMQLEDRDGGLWGRMPAKGLWLWAALIASRIVLTGVAVVIGAHAAASTDVILFALGANRLGQAGVIGLRAMAMGVPFAPEASRRRQVSPSWR